MAEQLARLQLLLPLLLSPCAGDSPCLDSSGAHVPCSPQQQRCGGLGSGPQPTFHVIDRGGCGNNDPNAP
jgi:hypothetical protein